MGSKTLSGRASRILKSLKYIRTLRIEVRFFFADLKVVIALSRPAVREM